MNYLLLLPQIRIENANAVAGITWGFPAITHFLGYVHALSRKVQQKHGVSFDGCAVISHRHHVHGQSSAPGRDFYLALTRNPLTKEGRTASFNEEGRMHLTVSLLISCKGEITNGEYGMDALCCELIQLCQQQKLAGGSIVSLQKPKIFHYPMSEQTQKKMLWQLMPGTVLLDRSEYLKEHHQILMQEQSQATLLDAWLDFSAIKYQAETESEQTAWRWQSKPMPGYLVPLMCGYQRISPLYEPGSVANTRDNVSPFAFAEAVYGVGEWRGLHRIPDIEALFWRYHSTDAGNYCAAGSVEDEPLSDDDEDDYE